MLNFIQAHEFFFHVTKFQITSIVSAISAWQQTLQAQELMTIQKVHVGGSHI